MTMFIVSKYGAVHRIHGNGVTCPDATRNQLRKTVSREQCFVYKLAPCERCWPKPWQYYNETGVR